MNILEDLTLVNCLPSSYSFQIEEAGSWEAVFDRFVIFLV